MFRTFRALRFLFLGPVVLVFLFFVNLMTTPGDWWIQWVALGIGIAWVICFFRVVTTALFVGGLTALGAYLFRRR